MPPSIMLPDFYRAVWWLQKTAEGGAPGTLADGGPYRDLGHLLRVVLNDSIQLMTACPPKRRAQLPYWIAGPAAGTKTAALAHADSDEPLGERCWTAAHEPGPVDDWQPLEFEVPAGGFADVLPVDDLELDLYSDAFRAAVEASRRPVDRHAWLPVTVTAPEREQCLYWVLNVSGQAAADTWGIHADLVGGRSVVLQQAGDDPPAFAESVKASVEAACSGIDWRTVR